MTVDQTLCKVLKAKGKWIPDVCEYYRNRKTCKDKEIRRPECATIVK